MLRGITSPSVIRSELEACQAERDFFKEKYTENTAIIEQLNNKLKDSQRVIDKLRSQILDLELEKSKLTGANSDAGGDSSKYTSITCTSSEADVVEDKNTISVEEDKLNTIVDNNDNCNNTPSKSIVQESVALDNVGDSSVDIDSPTQTDKLCIEEDLGDTEKDVDNNDDDEDEEDDDDIDKIRANAERMLLWANYQTSKRSNSTPKFDNEDDDESKSQTSTNMGNKIPVRRVMSTPIHTLEDKRQSSLSDDDESTLGSRHQPSVGSESKIGSGRKLFNRIADMIDGSPSDSESEDDDSDDDSADSSFADDREEVLMYNSEM